MGLSRVVNGGMEMGRKQRWWRRRRKRKEEKRKEKKERRKEHVNAGEIAEMK